MQTMELIFSELNNPRIAMRTVAARALGQIDGPATTARLVEMVTADTNRREALMALAYSNGPEAKEFLARALSSATLRSAVRSVLLQMKS
jgi:HEAT repeat protein